MQELLSALLLLLCLGLAVLPLACIIGLIKPSVFARPLGQYANRLHISAISGGSFIVLFALIVICGVLVEPDSAKQRKSTKHSTPPLSPQKTEFKPSDPEGPDTVMPSDEPLKGVFDLFSLSERRQIWEAGIRADRKARYDAGQRFPYNALIDTLRTGYKLVTEYEINLMPTPNPETEEQTWAALRAIRSLPIGTALLIEEDSVVRETTLWYRVSIGSDDNSDGGGWICASSFILELVKNGEANRRLERQLMHEYSRAHAKRYGLNRHQLDSISYEAFRNNWPLPDIL